MNKSQLVGAESYKIINWIMEKPLIRKSPFWSGLLFLVCVLVHFDTIKSA